MLITNPTFDSITIGKHVITATGSSIVTDKPLSVSSLTVQDGVTAKSLVASKITASANLAVGQAMPLNASDTVGGSWLAGRVSMPSGLDAGSGIGAAVSNAGKLYVKDLTFLNHQTITDATIVNFPDHVTFAKGLSCVDGYSVTMANGTKTWDMSVPSSGDMTMTPSATGATLQVGSATGVETNLSVSGDTAVAGVTTIGDSTNMTVQATAVTDKLAVYGNVFLGGNDGDVKVVNGIEAYNVTASYGISVNAPSGRTGEEGLLVGSTSELIGDVTVVGDVHVAGTSEFVQKISMYGGFEITDPDTHANHWTYSVSTAASKIQLNIAPSVAGQFTVDSDFFATQQLYAGISMKSNGYLIVDGATTLGATVNDATTINGLLTVDNQLKVVGDVTVDGSALVAEDINLTGIDTNLVFWGGTTPSPQWKISAYTSGATANKLYIESADGVTTDGTWEIIASNNDTTLSAVSAVSLPSNTPITNPSS